MKIPAIILALLFFSNVVRADEPLKIDPLLLKEAEAVWQVIARPDNSIWPGWDATDTPVMIYLPNEQEVLINHPHPSPDFKRYTGPLTFNELPIFYHDGKTQIEWDGQNTSREIFGVNTLIVADTLSNRKGNVGGWLTDPRPADEKIAGLEYASLRADPYDQMALIAHEAFHVFQFRELRHEGADERSVRLYPCLSVTNNVGLALEADALYDAITTASESQLRTAAARWLAVRLDRRKSLPAEAVAYEDANEFTEGLAKYVEFKLLEVLEGREPPPELWLAQGFEGFNKSAAYREKLLAAMRANMRGEVNVNNDLYGTAPVRFRLYFSGMAIAALLDRIDVDWKAKIVNPSSTLTALAQTALTLSDRELEKALAEARDRCDYKELIASKEQLSADGESDTQRRLDQIVHGPKTLLVVDYSALPDSQVGLAFTPFGVRGVDSNRTIYSMVPISASLEKGKFSFQQSAPVPCLQDQRAQTFQMQLNETISADLLAQTLGESTVEGWQMTDLNLHLPGVAITAESAHVSFDGQTIVVKFLPAN